MTTTEPGTIDFDEVVRLLKEADLPAYVEQTGGGTATISVGEKRSNERYDILVGPGWFEGPGWTNGRGSTDDLYIGPDDEGESNPVRVKQNWDELEVAREVRNQYATLRAKESFARAQIERLGHVAQAARDAWEAIDGTATADDLAAHYPGTLPDFDEVAGALAGFGKAVQV